MNVFFLLARLYLLTFNIKYIVLLKMAGDYFKNPNKVYESTVYESTVYESTVYESTVYESTVYESTVYESTHGLL